MNHVLMPADQFFKRLRVTGLALSDQYLISVRHAVLFCTLRQSGRPHPLNYFVPRPARHRHDPAIVRMGKGKGVHSEKYTFFGQSDRRAG